VIVTDWKNLERRSAEAAAESASKDNQAPPVRESSFSNDEDVPF
jgi:hypothetical protein